MKMSFYDTRRPAGLESVRIVRATVFRGTYVAPGLEIHDCTGVEAAVLRECGKAVRIPPRAAAAPAGPSPETAQAVPVVEVPEHRAPIPQPSAIDAQATTPKRKRAPRVDHVARSNDVLRAQGALNDLQ